MRSAEKSECSILESTDPATPALALLFTGICCIRFSRRASIWGAGFGRRGMRGAGRA